MAGHGHISTYTNGRCRCERCRAAMRDVQRGLRQRRRTQRVPDAQGRLIAQVPTHYHGRLSTYQNHGCRCGLCMAARREYGRARRGTERAS